MTLCVAPHTPLPQVFGPDLLLAPQAGSADSPARFAAVGAVLLYRLRHTAQQCLPLRPSMMTPGESTVAEVDAGAVAQQQPETSSGASSDMPPLPQKVVITPHRRCCVPALLRRRHASFAVLGHCWEHIYGQVSRSAIVDSDKRCKASKHKRC